MNNWKRYYAFTLIELLVVIVIMMILATITVPVMGKVREHARTVRCASNLRQLHIATMNYYASSSELPLSRSRIDPDDPDLDGNIDFYHHHAGWVAWYTYPSGYRSTSPLADGSYDWRGVNGLTCLTNGVLWSFVQADPSVFICPSFLRNCGVRDAVRSYAMNTNFSSASFVNKSSIAVLYGEDRNVANSPYIPEFSTNGLWRYHSSKGNVVCFDGHVELR